MRLKLRLQYSEDFGTSASLLYLRLKAQRKGDVSVRGWHLQLALHLLGGKEVKNRGWDKTEHFCIVSLQERGMPSQMHLVFISPLQSVVSSVKRVSGTAGDASWRSQPVGGCRQLPGFVLAFKQILPLVWGVSLRTKISQGQ